MTPAFDKNCNLALWVDRNSGNIFDTNMNWVGFMQNGYAFSSKTLNFLGSVDGGTLQDTNGKAAFWMPGLGSPSSGLRPLTPLRPLKPLNPLTPLRPLNPLKPLQPLAPLGGWSNLNLQAWLAA
ncbi:4-fold beta flower protein [Caballeronia sp. NCTM5]|uniref:4-fold beta flower protein n=1 Tax=Caballeronia sp. NCTM5 TaxID=2921755 RepID=UPI002028FAE7|nr:hypothetical protein [Caballeronia sp. NCTM5]